MAVALDSSAIIGYLDGDDAFHDEAAAAISNLLREGTNVCASVVSLAELMTGAKLGHHDESLVRDFFDELISWVVPIDIEVAERAADLRASHRSLKMPDALILACADLDSEVDRIICADEIAEKVDHLLDCNVQPLTPGS